MSTGFPTDFKEQVRSRTDIVRLIGETVPLTPKGNSFVALCPFHDDHNPSMNIYPDRQTYRCWSCNAGGDCFSWVQEIEGISFFEALKQLAEAANLEMPQLRGQRSDHSQKTSLYDVCSWAEREFHEFFLTSPAAEDARNYIQSRGYAPETVRKFRIGYHPENWTWILDRARRSFSQEQLLAAGLIAPRSDGNGFRDQFVGRVLFPIHDERGRTVAFGGRILPSSQYQGGGKYHNSDTTEIFSKRSLLFGFHAARDAIRGEKLAVVVEGYTDCITLHQQGLANVVGTLGTALTEEHVRNLKRFTRKVVLLFDGDEAGRRAAEKSLGKFVAEEIDLRVLTIPDGLDPADYIDRHGADALRRLIDAAPEALDYKLQSAVGRYGLDTIDARDRVITETLELLAEAPDGRSDLREAAVISKLSVRMGVDERTLRARLRDFRQTFTNRTSVNNTHAHDSDSRDEPPKAGFFDSKLTKDEIVECELLEIVFSAADSLETIRRVVGADDFRNPYLRRLMQFCLDVQESGELPTFERVTSVVEEPELKRIAVWIDEQAREKQIAQKLTPQDDTPQDEGPEGNFLNQALDNITWRRQERAHALRRGQFGHTGQSSAALDADKIAMLREATAHHQQRAAKRTIN